MTAGDDDPRLDHLDDTGQTTAISWRAPNRVLRTLFTDAYPYDRWPGINSVNDAVAQACQDISRLASADQRQLVDVISALDQNTGDIPLIVLGDPSVNVFEDHTTLSHIDPDREMLATVFSDYSPEEFIGIVTEYVDRHPEIDPIWASFRYFERLDDIDLVDIFEFLLDRGVTRERIEAALDAAAES